MSGIPKRTGRSQLSDDELLLFDMMFDCSAAATQMSADVYATHMNCEYCHGLDDEALRLTIESLLARKLLHVVGSSDPSDRRYGLTPLGGQWWEAERQPVWQQFVSTSQRQLGLFSSGSIVATCLDEQVGRKCLGAMFAAGLMSPAGSIRSRVIYNLRLLPWKTLPVVHVLRCRTSDDIRHSYHAVDWEVYESSRCWWRSIGELLRLPS